jgi:hypothetical protein
MRANILYFHCSKSSLTMQNYAKGHHIFEKFYRLLIFLTRIVGAGGGGVQTGSTRHVDHFWPIVPAPRDCEDGEFGGITIGRGDFFHHKSHLPEPGREPGPPRWEARD